MTTIQKGARQSDNSNNYKCIFMSVQKRTKPWYIMTTIRKGTRPSNTMTTIQKRTWPWYVMTTIPKGTRPSDNSNKYKCIFMSIQKRTRPWYNDNYSKKDQARCRVRTRCIIRHKSINLLKPKRKTFPLYLNFCQKSEPPFFVSGTDWG